MELKKYLQNSTSNSQLCSVLLASCEAITLISKSFSTNNLDEKVGAENFTGDQQIGIDILADEILTKEFSENSAVYGVGSEEKETLEIINPDANYCVVFDPLDGSSLVDVNFSVGTIIGVIKGKKIEGITGDDLDAAIYAVYGPRTQIVIGFDDQLIVATLKDNEFHISATNLKIKADTKYFAPGNLQANQTNQGYNNLITYWLKNQYKLRYSGGMVPDIHHILIKGEGIFCYPGNDKQSDGKLRLLYECLPMAKIITIAGGKATNGDQDILRIPVTSIHQQSSICLGSELEVKRYQEFLSS